ncbi:MAG TPA: collagen-like protein [Chitinophagaceae bacterium]|nr:collagen-like protein [Chitinophagaceae bacterium]
MRKFRLLSLTLLSITLIAISCTKEGPEGPAGTPGTQGPAGSPGAPGTPGAGITTYSPWFVTGSGWLEITTPTEPNYGEVFYFPKTAASVTQTIIDQGVVLCYMKGDPGLAVADAATPFQLPYSFGFGFGYIDHYDFTLTPGKIRFLYKSDNPWTAAQLVGVTFRYVTIPGTVAGRGVEQTYEGYTAAQLKAMPYSQVAELFHIPADGTNIK